MKKFSLIFLIATLALVGSGCGVTLTQNISGSGIVQLLDPISLMPNGSEATFSLNFACYAQNNNRVEGFLNWNDPTNEVKISATLPEKPVKVVTYGYITTCKQMKTYASYLGVSIATAGIYSEDGNANGNAGTLTGKVTILVTQPGASLLEMPNPCGETGTAVFVEETTQEDVIVYEAMGCLDRGKVTFSNGGQNQQ